MDTVAERTLAFLADRMRVTPEAVRSSAQHQRLVWTRKLLWLIFSPQFTLSELGQWFTGRTKPYKDHATVLTGMRMMRELMETEPWLRAIYEEGVAFMEREAQSLPMRIGNREVRLRMNTDVHFIIGGQTFTVSPLELKKLLTQNI